MVQIDNIKCVRCNKILTGKQEQYCSKHCNTITWKKKNPESLKKINEKYKTKHKLRLAKHHREYMKKYMKKYNLKYPNRNKTRIYVFRHKQRGSVCLLCGDIKNLQFHHTDYENNKGFTVCAGCHRAVHR